MGGYVEKYMFFFRFEYHMFFVLYPFMTYLLSLLRTFVSIIRRICSVHLEFLYLIILIETHHSLACVLRQN
jgi:hypothetical protein